MKKRRKTDETTVVGETKMVPGELVTFILIMILKCFVYHHVGEFSDFPLPPHPRQVLSRYQKMSDE